MTAPSVMPPRNQLSRLRDAVWHPTPRAMRMLALGGVIVNAGIVVSGGAVRVTRSGLGCPTWPKCTGDSLVPTSHPEHAPLNMAIEFGNRTLTLLVLAVGVACLIAALRLRTPGALRTRRRDLPRLAALQPLGVIAQAGLGGITVLTKLHPATVAGHYVLSAALIAAAVALHARASEGDDPPRPLVRSETRWLGLALAVVVAALLIAGTIVTGTGPHAGDDQAPRFGFDIAEITRLHSVCAWLAVALTVALVVTTRGAPSRLRRRTAELFALEVAQGAVGYLQYFLAVPAPLVVVHMLGSVLVWIAALRVLFAMRDRGPMPAAAHVGSAALAEERAQPV